MRAVHGTFAVITQQVFALEVVKILHAGSAKPFVGGLECRPAGVVALASVREQKGVGVGPVLDQHNGRPWMRSPELLHERLDPVADFGRGHVREAVEDIDAWVQLRKEIGEFSLHLAVAGKAQINVRAVIEV